MSHSFAERIFTIWTGSNQMSKDRKRCLASLCANSGLEVILIDQSNFAEWIASDLHPAYNFLSCTHKADYLRCYLMHHYGGGYSDIKYCNFDWTSYSSNLLLSDDLLMSGYRERRPSDIASAQPFVRESYSSLPGMCQFIFKPKTALTYKWIQQVHQYLDSSYDRLTESPGTYHPRAIYGGVHNTNIFTRLRYFRSRYPLSWNSILGSILHPITLAYRDRVDLSMPYINTSIPYR